MNNLTREGIAAIVSEAGTKGFQISREADDIVLIYTVQGKSPKRTHLKLQVGKPVLIYISGEYVPFHEVLETMTQAFTEIAESVKAAMFQLAESMSEIILPLTSAFSNFYADIPDEIKDKYSKPD